MELERLAKPALGMYKRMLKLAKRLPAADAADAKIQIREAFRANKDERNDERIRALLDTANKKLGYLKIITPKRFREEEEDIAASGSRRYIVHDGKVVEFDGNTGDVSGKAYSNWGPGNIDPESMSRHNAQMSRFRFENRAGPVKSPWDR